MISPVTHCVGRKRYTISLIAQLIVGFNESCIDKASKIFA